MDIDLVEFRQLQEVGIFFGSPFQVQGVYRRTALTRSRILEESRVMAFVYSFGITCIITLTLNICLN